MKEDHTRYCVVAFLTLGPYMPVGVNSGVDPWLMSTIAWLRENYITLPGPDVDGVKSSQSAWRIGIVEYDEMALRLPIGGGSSMRSYQISDRRYTRAEMEQVYASVIDVDMISLALLTIPRAEYVVGVPDSSSTKKYLKALANSFAYALEPHILKSVH